MTSLLTIFGSKLSFNKWNIGIWALVVVWLVPHTSSACIIIIMLTSNIMSIFFFWSGTYAAIEMQPRRISHSIVLFEYFSLGTKTFIWGIPNAKYLIYYTFCLYLMCKYNKFQQNMLHFNLSIFLTKFSLRNYSIISTTVFCTIWLDF